MKRLLALLLALALLLGLAACGGNNGGADQSADAENTQAQEPPAPEPEPPTQEALLQALPAPERPDYGPLYEAIGRLPERLRLTLVLFYFRDMQVASCAEVLGVPEGTVKSRLNKARKLLKEALGHEADL